MRESVSTLDLEKWEADILLNALKEFKGDVSEREEKNIINELIIKIIEAPEKKISINKLRKDFDER